MSGRSSSAPRRRSGANTAELTSRPKTAPIPRAVTRESKYAAVSGRPSAFVAKRVAVKKAVKAPTVTKSACAKLIWFSTRSEEHTSELQSLRHLVCRLLLEKKK